MEDNIAEYKKHLISNIDQLLHFIPSVIPANDQDEKIIKIGLDMMECLKKDLNNPAIPDRDLFDVNRVNRNWNEIESKLTVETSKEILDAISSIEDSYNEE